MTQHLEIKYILKRLRYSVPAFLRGLALVAIIVIGIGWIRREANPQEILEVSEKSSSPSYELAIITSPPGKVIDSTVGASLAPEKVTIVPITEATPSSQSKYVVRKGDSSWRLAELFYQDGYRYVEIERANNLSHNQWLEVEQELVIPGVSQDQLAQVEAKIESLKGGRTGTVDIPGGARTVEMQASGELQPIHLVVRGDYLWWIAQERLQDPYRWVEIYELNKDVIGVNPDLIYPGTVLKVPPQ